MLLHIHKNKVDRIELTDIARQFIQTNEKKKKEIFWNSTNERITSKIYYHIF